MGRTVMVSSLMAQVRQRGEWRSSWLPDAELLEYLNSSMAALQDLLLGLDPLHSQLLKMADVTITAGMAKYAWPTDLFNVYGISVWDGTKADGYCPLESVRWDERYADGYADAGVKTSARWTKFGDYFLLQPTPNWSGKVRVEYIRSFTAATNTAQTWDVDNSWSEWVVLDCCVKCCAKEESDPSVYMAQQKAVADRIAMTQRREDELLAIPRSNSSSTTLATLRRSVRNRGKFPVSDISDNMLTDWINSSVDALEDLILSINPTHSSMLTFSNIAVVAGTGVYSLPTGLHTLYGVAVRDATKPDGYSALEQFRYDERYADDYGNQGVASACRWERWGNKLRLQPIPTWSGTLRVEYAKSFDALTTPSSTLDFENSWNEWIILDVAQKACARVGADPAQFANGQKALAERMVAAMRMEDQIAQIPKASAGSTTLADLRRSVRARGQWMRNDVSDAQLTQFVNASLKQLLDIMIMGDPQMFDTRSDISVVSGTSEYSLPSNIYRLTGVAVRDDGNRDGYCVMPRVDFDERYDATLAYGEKYETRYMVLGSKIAFHPKPSWSDTVRLSYVAYPTTLSAPTDTFDFHNGWEEYVILDTCAKVALLRGQNPQPYQQMRDEVRDRINASVTRDISKPRTVVDSQRRWNRPLRLWRGVRGW